VRLIEAFDAARTEAWGEERGRSWPNQLDKVTADRWLAAGASTVFHRMR
jgi:hypothetical protein